MKWFLVLLLSCAAAFAQVPAGSLLAGAAGSSGLQPATDMLLWWKADGNITFGSSNDVAVWLDHSGHGNNAFNATAGSSRPLFQTNQINGLPAIYFNAAATPRFDLTNMFTSETSAELFVVVKLVNDPTAGTADSGQWRFAGTGDINIFPYSDGNIYEGFCSTVRKTVGNPTPTLTSWRLYNTSSTNGSWIARLDGTQIFSTAVNTFTSDASGIMATDRRFGQSGSTSSYMNGRVAEVILYGRVLSSADRDQVESYIASKYALTIN
jgi:hypothetical protein